MHNFRALKIGTNIFSKKLNGEWAIEPDRAQSSLHKYPTNTTEGLAKCLSWLLTTQKVLIAEIWQGIILFLA